MKLSDFRLEHCFHEWDFHVRAGTDRSHGHAKALYDTLLIRRNNEGALPGEEKDQPCEEDVLEATGRNEISELRLRLLEGFFKRIVSLTPGIFGVPDHAVLAED
jgi:hypothetical protein